MNKPPAYMAIELGEKDVREDLAKIANSMSRLRAETIVDGNLTKEQKDEYLHMVYRMASGIKAVADESMAKRMSLVADRLTKNPSLLQYDPMQDEYWKKEEPGFVDSLDSLLIAITRDDFHNADASHHVLQAIKYLGVEDLPLKDREAVYNTIIPFNFPVLSETKQGILKRIFNELFGVQYDLGAQQGLTLNVDAAKQGFSQELIETARERGCTKLRLKLTDKEFKRIKLGPRQEVDKLYTDFKVGDKVVSTGNVGNTEHSGIKGEVILANDGRYGVSWEEHIGGHKLHGQCREGYGWFVDAHEIQLLRPISDKEPNLGGLEIKVVKSDEIKPSKSNETLINIARKVVKYTCPISYPMIGMLPYKLQSKLEDKLGINSVPAFFSSLVVESVGAVTGFVEGAVSNNILHIILGVPLFFDAVGRFISACNNEHNYGSALLKPFFYPIEKYFDKGRKPKNIMTVEIPVRKIKASEQVQNPAAYYETIAKLEVPENIEKSLVWSTENYHSFGGRFLEFANKHAGEKPNGIQVSECIDREQRLVCYSHELSVDGFRKNCSLYCFSGGRRYTVTAIGKNKGQNRFDKTTGLILASESDVKTKLSEIGKQTGAIYAHLKEYINGKITNDIEASS